MNKWNGIRTYTQSTTGGTDRMKSSGHNRHQSYIRCEDNVCSPNTIGAYESRTYAGSPQDNTYLIPIVRPAQRMNVPDIRALHKSEVNYRQTQVSPVSETVYTYGDSEHQIFTTPSKSGRRTNTKSSIDFKAHRTVNVNVPRESKENILYHARDESNDQPHDSAQIHRAMLAHREAYITFEQHTDELTKTYDRGFHDGLLEGMRRQKMNNHMCYNKDVMYTPPCCGRSHCGFSKKKRNRARSTRTKSKGSKDSANDSDKSQYYSDYNSIGRSDSASNHRRRHRSKSIDPNPEVRSKVLGLVDNVLNTIEYLDHAAQSQNKSSNIHQSQSSHHLQSIEEHHDDVQSIPSIPLLNINNVEGGAWHSGHQTQGQTYFT